MRAIIPSGPAAANRAPARRAAARRTAAAEAGQRGAPLGQILRRGDGGAFSGARAPAPVHEGRVHHRAAPARLAHRERQLAIVAVEEAVALVEAPDALENRAGHEQAHPVHRRHLHHRLPDRGVARERVHDGPAHVPPVAAEPPDPVEAGQSDAAWPVHRGLQTLEPARLPHLGVVVQEAEAVAGGGPRSLIQGLDQADVGGIPDVAELATGPLAEEARGVVGGGVVHHAQLERPGAGAEALQAGARERELVVDDQDDAGQPRAATARRAGRT
jgi:hypothetical protein